MILIDLEGTLSEHDDRLALLKSRTAADPRNRTAWKEYYAGLMEDAPRLVIMDMVHDWLNEDIDILVYSTRFMNKHHHEIEWLKKHELWGRVIFKQRMSNETGIKGPDLVAQWVQHFKPPLIIDDRDDVRATLEGLHMPELKVYHWEDFDADTTLHV